MKTSDEGRKLIEGFEGLKLKAYQDSIGIWTIGYGHTTSAGEPKVHAGLEITKEQADQILARDLSDSEKTVNDAVRVPLTQNQFDALVSLVFNIGGRNFRHSTILKHLNYKDYRGAAKGFHKWTKAAGKTLQGLVRRRNVEATLFLKEDK